MQHHKDMRATMQAPIDPMAVEPTSRRVKLPMDLRSTIPEKSSVLKTVNVLQEKNMDACTQQNNNNM